MRYLAIILICLPSILCGQIAFNQADNNNFERYFKIENNQIANLTELGKIISIDHKTNANTVYAYANPKQYKAFLQLNIPHTVLQNPSNKNVTMGKQPIGAWNYYPTYEEYVSMLNQYANNFPNICQLVNFGTTNQGRQLLALKITDNPNITENEPKFLYTSSMHGDELTGYVLTLRLIDYLLNNYATDNEVSDMVNEIEIWINPLANPDGTFAAGNNTVMGATRGNANLIDINRNFIDLEVGDHPDGNSWQLETIAFMNLADSVKFNISCNLHGGAEVCNYPWDTWETLAADDLWWQHVCNEYADLAQDASPGTPYLFGFDGSGIINGNEWYEIKGGRQDYMNYFHNCREFTLEISNQKTPIAENLPDLWDYNKQSLLNYIKQSLYGLRGIVTDSITGLPLKAEVFINGHDVHNSHVYSSMEIGNYHRYLYEDNYSVTFSADGYQPKTIDVAITNNQTTTLDVALVPIGIPINLTNINQPKKLAKVVDINGRPTPITYNKVLLFIYEDGTAEKKVIVR